ncbi:MAG: PadR family transcriptional regulator [bacterium]|nr:PadR family transcriptional regulator [bacterium]
MIRGIILSYLNVKPTHGYEIQKFLQLQGTDQWTKIQSGSIYYALTKLEKEKNIEVLREEHTGSRVRKIYKITELGKQTLIKEMEAELAAPITNVGSMKFITAPMLSTLPKEEMQIIIKKHIDELKKQEEYWISWSNAKAAGSASKLLKLSFQMSIDSLKSQIAWHEELLQNIEQYIEESQIMINFIRTFDSERYELVSEQPVTKQSLILAEQLKKEVLDDPLKAIQNLDRIIEELKRQL